MNKKLFFILGAALIILILVLIYFRFGNRLIIENVPITFNENKHTATTTNSQNDNADFTAWHTYTNAALGYMFEYPAAYDTDTQFENCSIDSADGAITIGSRSYIQVDADNKQTLKQFIKKTLDEHAEEEWTIEKQTQTTVGDESAVTVEYRFGIVNRFGSITFVHHNNYFYTISFQAGAFACGNEPAVYEHILKTFKWVQYKED